MVTIFDSKVKSFKVLPSDCRFKAIQAEGYTFQVKAYSSKEEFIVGSFPLTSIPNLDFPLFEDCINRLNKNVSEFLKMSDDVVCVFPRDIVDNLDWSQLFRDAERGSLTIDKHRDSMIKG